MQGTKAFSLYLLAVCGIVLRGRIQEVVASCGGPPPQHVAAALCAAYRSGTLLEFGAHCLVQTAGAATVDARGKAFCKGIHVPGGKKGALREIPLAVWRATSELTGNLVDAGSDIRGTYAGQCRLSFARNDGVALRETQHPFDVPPGAQQNRLSAEEFIAGEWPQRQAVPGEARLPALSAVGIRSTAIEADVAAAKPAARKRLQRHSNSLFWLLSDAEARGLARASGSEGVESMICAPVRTPARTNIAYNTRGSRCAECVSEAEALAQATRDKSGAVHPYLGSFLRVVQVPSEAQRLDRSAGSSLRPVYMRAPVTRPQPWFAAAEASAVSCAVCGAAGQLPRLLAHVAICRGTMRGRIDAPTSRKLASLAAPVCQNAEGGSSRAPGAKTTSQQFDLAQLRINIPGADSEPAPDQLWSRGLRFRILCLNVGRGMSTAWPLVVHEIRAVLPLVVVVGEAEIQDASGRDRIRALILWALQGRHRAAFTTSAVVLIAHSLRPTAAAELTEIEGVPDVVAAAAGHQHLAGLLVLGYLPPPGKKSVERREHRRTLLAFLRHRRQQLVGVAGDLNMSTGSVWGDGFGGLARNRSSERQAIWGLMLEAGLQNGLDEHDVAHPYAESQPDAVFLKPRLSVPPMAVYTDVEPPAFMKLDGSSHLRITAGIREATDSERRDLPEGKPTPLAADAALARRHIWNTESAPAELLERAAAAVVATVEEGSHHKDTIPQELQRAGIRKSKAKQPPAPTILFNAANSLSASSAESMEIFKGRLCDGRPAGTWRSPAEEADLAAAADELINAAPDVPLEATHDLADRAAARLNPKAAPGTDGVSPKFLLRLPKLILALVLLFVRCINDFADLPWAKEYGVAWLYKVTKKGASLFLPRFWRPISMISVTDKLAEAVLLESILPLVASVRDSFAFHAGISPAMGLLRAICRALLSDARYVGVIIADIQGGYENAVVLDVLRALRNRGASRQILRAIWWWFLQRTRRIMLDGRLSAAFVISEGLGQGTLLSPVLFRLVVEFRMAAEDIVSTLHAVATGYCDDICVFLVAETEAELVQKLTQHGSDMLRLGFPLADWRIGVLRSPELTGESERVAAQFLRRVVARLRDGTVLRPPEVLGRMAENEPGGDVATAFRPTECVKFLGVPLTTSSAAWKAHFDGLEQAIRSQEHAIIALAKNRKLSTLEIVDKYHERCFNLLTYMASVKSVPWPESLQRADEIAEGSLRRLLAISSTAPAYSTFLSAGAQIPSTAALAERATASVMAEAIDDEVFRASARVAHCFDFFRAGWRTLPVSLGLGPGVGLPDNVVILRGRDVFQLYGMPLSQANTPSVAVLVREKMELLDRMLGPAVLLVGTDSGDAEVESFVQGERNFEPPDKMATLRHHLPDLSLRDFCPQLSAPLRLVRAHIRDNLRDTVVKEVSTRGDQSATGCMRGTLAARFGSLRRWLKGLSTVQQEICFSVMSGDGRAAARHMGAKVGADCLRCGICDGRVA
eukprot:g19049.t1